MRIVVTAAFITLLLIVQQSTAQGPSAPDLTKALYVSAANVSAAVAATVAKQGTAANGSTRVMQLAPYTVNIEHRIAVPQAAAVHDKEAELFYILDGSATLVTGGKLVDPTRNGDNVNGKSIEGGTSQALAKGDYVIVPQGVPHWFATVQGSITQISLHLPMPASK